MNIAPPPDPFEEEPLPYREYALQQARVTSDEVDAAKAAYQQAVLRAHAAGWSNTAIAMVTGKTEAAIRFYIRRHQGKQDR